MRKTSHYSCQVKLVESISGQYYNQGTHPDLMVNLGMPKGFEPELPPVITLVYGFNFL